MDLEALQQPQDSLQLRKAKSFFIRSLSHLSHKHKSDLLLTAAVLGT